MFKLPNENKAWMLFDLVNKSLIRVVGNFITVVFGGECGYEWNDTCFETRISCWVKVGK